MINKTETKPTGRPKKLTFDDKKHIVTLYLLSHGNDPAMLKTYGINTKLAAFAAQYPQYATAKGYDFSNDEQVQNYIASLAASLDDQAKEDQLGLAYVPLNYEYVCQLATRGRLDDLRAYLKSREDYFAELYDRAASAASLTQALSNRLETANMTIIEYENTIRDLREKLAAAVEEADDYKARAQKTDREKTIMTKIIKENEDRLAILSRSANAACIGPNTAISSFCQPEDENERSTLIDLFPKGVKR